MASRLFCFADWIAHKHGYTNTGKATHLSRVIGPKPDGNTAETSKHFSLPECRNPDGNELKREKNFGSSLGLLNATQRQNDKMVQIYAKTPSLPTMTQNQNIWREFRPVKYQDASTYQCLPDTQDTCDRPWSPSLQSLH